MGLWPVLTLGGEGPSFSRKQVLAIAVVAWRALATLSGQTLAPWPKLGKEIAGRNRQ